MNAPVPTVGNPLLLGLKSMVQASMVQIEPGRYVDKKDHEGFIRYGGESPVVYVPIVTGLEMFWANEVSRDEADNETEIQNEGDPIESAIEWELECAAGHEFDPDPDEEDDGFDYREEKFGYLESWRYEPDLTVEPGGLA